MDDLLKATGYAAIVYLIFNYLISFGSGRPLVEWINPGRSYLPLLALTMLGGAYGSLRVAALKTPEQSQVALLMKLITEERAPPEVVGAMSLVSFSIAILMLALWCWWTLPRAPQNFNANPKDLLKEYTRALKHYVKWKGGVDFAIICEVRKGQLEVVSQAAAEWDILRGLNRMPGVHVPINKTSLPLVHAQIEAWTKLALELFKTWPTMDTLLSGAKQGRSIATTVDLRYGAVFGEMIEDGGTQPDGSQVGIFLFAVSMNQYEVSTLIAHRHFAMLSQAIRHIRSGVVRK